MSTNSKFCAKSHAAHPRSSGYQSLRRPRTQRAHVGGPDGAAILEGASHQIRVVHRLAAAQVVRCSQMGGQDETCTPSAAMQ